MPPSVIIEHIIINYSFPCHSHTILILLLPYLLLYSSNANGDSRSTSEGFEAPTLPVAVPSMEPIGSSMNEDVYENLFPYTEVIQWGHTLYHVTLNQQRSWAFDVQDYVEPRLRDDDGDKERQWLIACWLHEQAEKTVKHMDEEGKSCLFEDGICVVDHEV